MGVVRVYVFYVDRAVLLLLHVFTSTNSRYLTAKFVFNVMHVEYFCCETHCPPVVLLSSDFVMLIFLFFPDL